MFADSQTKFFPFFPFQVCISWSSRFLQSSCFIYAEEQEMVSDWFSDLKCEFGYKLVVNVAVGVILFTGRE